MKRSKYLYGFLILTFWLLMTGVLLHRELSMPWLVSSDQPLSLPVSGDAWMGVYLPGADRPEQERRVGQIHMVNSPQVRQGLAGMLLELSVDLRLNLLDKATEFHLEGNVWRPLELPRAQFEFAVRSAGHDVEILGEVADGMLRGVVKSAGETLPLEIPMDSQVLFASGLGSALSLPVLEVGEEVRMQSFDPLTFRQGEARLRCVAREVLERPEGPISTSRLEVEMGGFKSVAWIDQQGDMVRVETPVGLVIERLSGPPPGVVADVDVGEELLGLTAIRPRGVRPFRGARSLTVALSGLEGLALPEDRNQVALGEGRYRLQVPSEPGSSKVSDGEATGDGAGGNAVLSTPELAQYLGSDPFVQASHPKIRQRAQDIIGDETDPWRRALLLHEWVFTHLDKAAVLSVPSALEVLAQRRGDCNEHAVLYTALARAVDLPTRIAIGVVWSDELNGFYYHAWPEVYLAEGWVWLDPTLDQPRADATHLKILNGGIESWPQLLPYLGQLKMEVLEVE